MKNIKILLIALMVFLFASLGVTNANSSLPQEETSNADYVYRFWSDVFHGHFFTIDYDEAIKVKDTDSNWNYEKVAFSAYETQVDGTEPLYRFWSDVFHGHFYTSDYSEYVKVKNTDSNWNYEWIAYYVYPLDYSDSVQTQIVYRFWSPVFLHHFYTADYDEMVKVRDTDSNWDYEGPVFRVPLSEGQSSQEIDDISVTGNGDKVTQSFYLEKGLSIFESSYSGESNFITYLLEKESGDLVGLVSNTIGTSDSKKYLKIPSNGNYVLEVMSEGNWEFSIKQPRGDVASAQMPYSKSGSGDEVFAVRLNQGLVTSSGEHTGESNFIVYLIDQDGNHLDLVANGIGDYDFSNATQINQTTTYYYTVSADGDWTININ